jgi:hypothetical protein
MAADMPTINYAKEWHRIAVRLEWSAIRLRKQLEAAETEEERAVLTAKLQRVQEQIEQAHTEAARFTVKRDTPE